MQPVGLQELIHKFEEGEGTRHIRTAFFLLALLGLTAFWHIREARNFYSVEAMDSAQVARNMAEGEGFTTKFIRPLSLALLDKQRGSLDTLLKQPHPDLANAPLYPLALAGVLKMLPLDSAINEAFFRRFQPEMAIGGFNQILFFAALFLVFRISSRIFDKAVGYLAVMLMALTELFWEFTTSGLSTMLLIVLFLGLIQLMIAIEDGTREGQKSKTWLLSMAVGAGVMVGAMALTRYSMAFLIVPVLFFLFAAGGLARVAIVPAAVAGFVLLLAPWLVRNYQVSGTLFGTAGYAIHQGTADFPGNLLERALPRDVQLELNKIDLEQYPRKLFVNGRDILTSDLPQAAGSWIGGLFLASLLIPFRNLALARLKWFAAGTLLIYLVVQALGKTDLSTHSPVFNSENLLVVFTPLFFIFGAGFFFILLDQIEFSIPWLRSVTIVGFVVIMSLPLIFRILPPRTPPNVFPPYFPPLTQTVAHWLGEDELMMSDMPWAVAWYGDRQCVWTTLDAGADTKDDFYRLNDECKAIKGILLTPLTTNARFLTEMRKSREGIWGKFYLDTVVLKNLPTGFPLKIGPPGLLPDWLFLSDRIRWRQ